MTRALILVRQSLTKRDSVSLESQESACRAYCEAHRYDPVRVLSEASVRGWWDDREAIAEVYRLAERRAFDVLVTWDLSRVARSVRQVENLVYELGKRGARYESVNEAWVSSPLVRQVIAAAAEEQTRTISRNVASAIRKRAESGIWHGATPYGYRRGEDHRLEVVRTEANVISRIFVNYADGWRIADIVAALNADPTVPPRRRGARWTTGAIWKLLRAEVYAGRVVVDPSVAGQAPFGGVVVDGAHGAIIDRALWERVRRRIADGRPRAHAKPETHWLEGHVFCGCGAPMYFVVRTGRTDRLWTCRDQTLYRNGVRAAPCPEPVSSAGNGWVERGVVALLGQTLARAGDIPDDRLRKLVSKPDRRAEDAATELAALKRQRDNLIAAIRHGTGLVETLAPELAAVAERIAAAERTVAAHAPVRTLASLQSARRYAAELAGTVQGEVPPSGLRAIAEQLGLRVTVSPAEWRVTLGFGEGFGWLGTPSRAGKRTGAKGAKPTP